MESNLININKNPKLACRAISTIKIKSKIVKHRSTINKDQLQPSDDNFFNVKFG